MANSSAYYEFIHIGKCIISLIEEGEDETEEAASLREEADVQWDLMNSEERSSARIRLEMLKKRLHEGN